MPPSSAASGGALSLLPPTESRFANSLGQGKAKAKACKNVRGGSIVYRALVCGLASSSSSVVVLSSSV